MYKHELPRRPPQLAPHAWALTDICRALEIPPSIPAIRTRVWCDVLGRFGPIEHALADGWLIYVEIREAISIA